MGATPHGGKWFQLWFEDKQGILASMHRNLAADLSSGYNYQGDSIQKQLRDIEEYQGQFDSELDKFVLMEDGEVSRWCYYDLKKRGAIL